MIDQGTRLHEESSGNVDVLTAAQRERAQQFRRRALRQRRMSTLAGRLALPAMLLALVLAVSIPLPARAAQVGSGWSTRFTAAGSVAAATTTMTRHELATTQIAFTGRLLPSARRTVVTIVLQSKSAGATTTLGTVMMRAERAFNTPAISLAALISEMGVAPRPATTYVIAATAGSTTLTSATVTIAS